MPDWAAVPLTELCEHIVERYHAAIREDMPAIERLLLAARQEVGAEAAFLDSLLRGWKALGVELRAHLDKEEAALFPLVARLERSGEGDLRIAEALFDGLGREHDDAALALVSLARMTSGFRPPEGASPVLRELYERLERFDADLREHVRLETEVLLPRARRLAIR
jgi:regulator of cell morphogenesis and NO signaling